MTDITNNEILRALKSLEERIIRLEHAARLPATSPTRVSVPSTLKPTPALKPPTSTELKIGQKWLSIVGVILVFLAALFFVQFVFKFVGPAGKVGLSYLGAAVLFGVAFFTRQKYPPFAAAVSAGAWAVTYLVTYAMHFFPATRVITSTPLALGLLTLAVAVLLATALYQRSKILICLGMVLGFLTVVLSPLSLFSIVGVVLMLAVLAAIAVTFPWGDLVLPAAIGAYVSYFFWFSNLLGRLPAQGGGIAEKQLLALLALALIWIITAIAILLRRDKDEAIGGHTDALTVVLTSAGTAILGIMVIKDLTIAAVTPRFGQALWLLVLTGISGGWAAVTQARRPKNEAATTALVAAIVLLMGSLAYFLPSQSGGTALGWAALGLVVVIAGAALRKSQIAAISVLPLIASAVRFLASDLQKDSVALTETLHLNVALGTLLALVIAASAALLRTLDLSVIGDKRARHLPGLLIVGTLTVLYGMAARELEGALPSIIWGLAGLLTIAAGFLWRWKDARLIGLLALAATVARVFVHDLSDLEALPRVISFAILGGLLLLVGYGYNRNKEKLQKYLEEEA